jgi:hypothetical protein
MRHLVQVVCLHAQSHRGGFFSSDSLPKDDVRALAAWEEATRAWTVLQDLEGAVAAATDLSALYLREYALELVRKIQFPISSSLPWLLAAHATRTKSLPLLPASFLPLHIYNQAGLRAVGELRRAHLLREVKAESDIAYDQLAWRLARRLVVLAKVAASADLFENTTPSFPRRANPGESSALERVARVAAVHLLGEDAGCVATRVATARRLIGQRVLQVRGRARSCSPPPQPQGSQVAAMGHDSRLQLARLLQSILYLAVGRAR